MLTDRKRLFIARYIETRNATQSVKDAGYSVKTAPQIASRLLKDVDVAAAIEKVRAEDAAKLTRDSFVSKAMENYDALTPKEQVRSRYLELAGKAVGILSGSDSSSSTTVNNIDIKMLNMDGAGKWEALRKLLG